MASGQGGAVGQIGRLFRDGTVGAMSDGQLLDRFATRRGEAAESAFEALVIRHGPMVLRVCRGTLRDPHDVDDAFQATFLVLVRRAGAIADREALGPWLHGVALRVSRKARSVAARRRGREGGIVDDPPADEVAAAALDLRPILHEELGRLPEKYRRPVVLCHLQGLTHAEAARELAWPVGTVSVRLARARQLLRDRLSRRGLTATAALGGAGLAGEAASAAVPEVLIRSTTRAATAFAAGRAVAAGVVPASSMALARRIPTMMALSRWKWTAVPLALALGAAGGVAATRALKVRAPAPGVAEKPATVVPLPAVPPEDDPSMDQAPPRAVPPLVVRGNAVELDPPPGYFDLPAPDRKDGTDPPPVQPGQVLQVEVLEALPGRPISGERLVRPDGTISLGFYGDLRVAGLNRHQIKVKLIEHLRGWINDEVLGLTRLKPADGVYEPVPPVESSRVFVDESRNFLAEGQAPPGRIQAREDTAFDLAREGRLDVLEGRINTFLSQLEQLSGARPPAGPPDRPADPARTPASPAEARDRRIDGLRERLRLALKELEDLGVKAPPGGAGGASPGPPGDSPPRP